MLSWLVRWPLFIHLMSSLSSSVTSAISLQCSLTSFWRVCGNRWNLVAEQRAAPLRKKVPILPKTVHVEFLVEWDVVVGWWWTDDWGIRKRLGLAHLDPEGQIVRPGGDGAGRKTDSLCACRAPGLKKKTGKKQTPWLMLGMWLAQPAARTPPPASGLTTNI